MLQTLLPEIKPKTLLSRFFDVAQTYPNRIALQDDKKRVSYGELQSWIDNIASVLSEYQVKEGDFVAVAVTPSMELLAALLAVQYTGAAYVPIDTKAPKDRNLLILNDANPVLILGDTTTPNYEGFSQHNVHHLIKEKSALPTAPMVNRASEEGVAYVIYTSGTTGKPKGVPITHKNLQALFTATEQFFTFNEQDIGLLYHSFAFDFSVWEIWSMLGYGGKLIIPSEETRVMPEKLAKLIAHEKITILNQTPTAFSVNASSLCNYYSESLALRFIVFGGERLNFQALEKWNRHFGLQSPQLVNMYGITETTVHASLHVVNQNDLENIESNIGKLLPHFDYIIRPFGDEEPDEHSGELLLSGPQITHGYLNISHEECSKFIWLDKDGISRCYYCSGDIVRHNKNNELIFLGRRDHQTKINGYRIEIGEIESVLSKQSNIHEICVVNAQSPIFGHHLICFYTTIESADVATKQLKAHAKAALPVYMRPVRYRKIGIIPKTVNGKVDKKAMLNMME
ncbi:Dimodular nonribosomal peptide synthase [Vibrio ruber DSM 16370]|uniref:Dimodular nonribosomal peptide synthase n=1 Tax=Vibrio ruber (strain DSM 16370 / JCM 11486 / BCRC 17186 / CECT 7878 / LMG 23124 / VR1) TaxID=1123498 RepID=A0A1R4LGG1_VIBR1|nr:amino acid adenylation domain-containing protein [Vibrio ruber]SJN55364.1 Dimodular nonribosomal peptide synthase [Vibrio ruber DSM 16370]